MDKIKIVTSAALFDGHDVSINIFRRLLQKLGAEVVHLGHNRSVSEVAKTALEEDAHAVLISSYQGGHNEYFRFLKDTLAENGADDILIFGGGGGVILPSEIESLQKYGIEKIYHALEGQTLGIDGIAKDVIQRIKNSKRYARKPNVDTIIGNKEVSIYDTAKLLSILENNADGEEYNTILNSLCANQEKTSIIIGVTGTGGSGKSSVLDELIGRFLAYSNLKIAIMAVDPSKSKTGGALLGDRIRYNRIDSERVFFRSFAARSGSSELSPAVFAGSQLLSCLGYNLIFVETSGIGQGNSQISEISDISVYVMTAEFGAPSQLEKIDMLDIADFIVINKFEKIGSEDALREVKINYIRSRNSGADNTKTLDEMDLPVYAASANQFNNSGLNHLFKDLSLNISNQLLSASFDFEKIDTLNICHNTNFSIIPHDKTNYLNEISNTVRAYKQQAKNEAEKALQAYSINNTILLVEDSEIRSNLSSTYNRIWDNLSSNTRLFIDNHSKKLKELDSDEIEYNIQGTEYTFKQYNMSLSGTKIPKVIPPSYKSWYELILFYYLENLPGEFPYTSGVFPYKRTTEDPKRQFAGEGSPERTNRRFHYLSKGDSAKRLSVAFDGITLYAEDPALSPDIYGKIGESGVSICTIDDMDTLLKGFDLTDPLTSVSMTINAPAPIMTAFYFMTAFLREKAKFELEGEIISDSKMKEFKLDIFRRLRGTVQADMLKEDQGQNTCIFSIDFAMKLIGDMQEYFSLNKIKNYYSISISGYHIAEAGANPITQLAFTLANGFTYVEYFLSRGIHIDDFAPNLSFFFSNGMDPEYSVIGRVARRIWAIALRNKYGANDKSCKLKYHIQTSGRSLHAQEIEFNDIRTTLQGLLAFYDNCNSLHTNSYDEAVTTPTEESVRRSMAIQLILSKEFGMLKNENPNQGSFLIETLTELVEEAVLAEFERLSRRGGVLGAMETQYQRSKIQEESMIYEQQKQNGDYPIIGVNTFLAEKQSNEYDKMTISRAEESEKQQRIKELNMFHDKNIEYSAQAVENLKAKALAGANVFEELLETVQYASMGEITKALYEIGGKYRRGV